MDIDYDFIPKELILEHKQEKLAEEKEEYQSKHPLHFGYDIVADFNRKWGEGAMNTPERTLSLLFPDINKALMNRNKNLEMSENEEGEVPAESSQRSKKLSTGRYHQVKDTSFNNESQDVFLPFNNKKFQSVMDSYLSTFGSKEDKELFRRFLSDLQEGKNFMIDPKEIENIIVDTYLKDRGVLKIDQDSHFDITNLLTSTIYSSMGQVYDYLHMPNKEKLNIGAKTIVDYGISSAFNLTSLAGGALATTKVLSGASKLLSSKGVQKITSSLFSRFMNQNTYLTSGIGISEASAKFLSGILVFGYYNRVIEPIVNRLESTYKTKKLLDVLGVTEKRNLIEEYKSIDFNPKTVLKEDLALGVELAALGGGVLLAAKTPSIIHAKLKESFSNSIKNKKGIKIDLDKAPEEFSSEEKEHILDASLDGEALENFENMSEVARSNGESLDSDLNSKDTNSLVKKTLLDNQPDEIDNKTFSEYARDLYNKERKNKKSIAIEKESDKIYKYDIEDIANYGWEKVSLLKTAADGIAASEINFKNELFSELKEEITDIDFYTNDEKINKVYNALQGIIKFPEDNKSLISTSMKMIGLGEIEAKRIFGVSNTLKETFVSTNMKRNQDRAYYVGVVSSLKAFVKEKVGESQRAPSITQLDKIRKTLNDLTDPVDLNKIDSSLTDIASEVGFSIEGAKEKITNRARAAFKRYRKGELQDLDNQHLKAFIDQHNTLPNKFSTLDKFKDAVRNSYNKIEYGVDTQSAVLEDAIITFKKIQQTVPLLSADDIFVNIFDHLNYETDLHNAIIEVKNKNEIIASVKKVLSIYNFGYKQLLDSFGKNVDKTKYIIKGYHPQDLNLSQLRGLKKSNSNEYNRAMKAMYNALDLERTREVRDRSTELTAQKQIRKISNKHSIDPITIEDITEDGIIYKEIRDEYKKLSKYVKKRFYKKLLSEGDHKKLMFGVLDNLIYDSITDDIRTKKTNEQTMNVRIPMTDAHRVFYYKSLGEFYKFSEHYSLFSSPMDLFINRNRRNIRQRTTINMYGDVNIHKNLMKEFPYKPNKSKLLLAKGLVDKHTTWTTQNIINRLLSNNPTEEMFNNPIWDVATRSIKTASDISNLGSVIFSIIPADVINSMVQMSGMGIKARAVFGELISNFVKGLNEVEAQKILKSRNKAIRFQLKESMKYTPEQKARYPTSMKLDDTLTHVSDAFFTYNLTNRWNETSMYTIKRFLLSNLFEEMKSGSFKEGKTWSRLEKYGLTESIFSSLKKAHTDANDFLFDYLPKLKEGTSLMAAVEYFTNEVIVHMSPYTKSIFSQLGSFGNLLLYTQFYLYGTTLQESVDKLMYPLFVYGNKNKFAMNVMGDLLSAIITKALKAITSGKKPLLNSFDFYRNLGEFMPSLSFFGNIISDRLSRNGIVQGGDNFGIYKTVWNALNLDVYSLYKDISPMKTTPFIRILNDRLILDNIYKGLHSSESYGRHITTKKRYNEKEGTPMIYFGGEK